MPMPDFSKQVGPLPLGAWVVVIGAGIGIAYTSRNSGNAEPVSDSSAVADASSNYTEDVGGMPGVGEGPGWVSVSPPTTAPDTPVSAVIETNEEWERAAIDWLIANNYPAATAYSAITKAFDGQSLSVTEYALWQTALRGKGTPPIPVTVEVPSSVPGPVIPVVTNTPKPGVKYHVIKPGDTLGKVSKKYYGHDDFWQSIRRANHYGAKRFDNSAGYIPTNFTQNTALTPRFVGRRLIIPTLNR